MKSAFVLGGEEIPVALSRSAHGYRLHLDGQAIDIALSARATGEALLEVAGKPWPIHYAVHGEQVFIHLDGESHELRFEHPLERLAQVQGEGGADAIRAPMPGSVIAVRTEAGATVEAGQVLVVIESMKMETAIAAPRDGVVAELRLGQGETFDRDAVLLTLEPIGESA